MGMRSSSAALLPAFRRSLTAHIRKLYLRTPGADADTLGQPAECHSDYPDDPSLLKKLYRIGERLRYAGQ